MHRRGRAGRPIYTLGAAKARDAYVDFLTDGGVKTYAEADARTKIKANALPADMKLNVAVDVSFSIHADSIVA